MNHGKRLALFLTLVAILSGQTAWAENVQFTGKTAIACPGREAMERILRTLDRKDLSEGKNHWLGSIYADEGCIVIGRGKPIYVLGYSPGVVYLDKASIIRFDQESIPAGKLVNFTLSRGGVAYWTNVDWLMPDE